MNLFEDWDATEKRTQQQQQQQQPSRYAATTRPQQQQQQHAQQQRQRTQPPESPTSRDVGSNPPQRKAQGGGRALDSSAWGQGQAAASPAATRSSATAVAAGAGSSASKMNPFGGGGGGGGSSALNPFASPSSNPFATSSSNPFGAGSTSNPFGSGAAGPDGSNLVPAAKRGGEPPIFSLQRLDVLKASSSSSSASWSILAVAVGNGTLAMATSDCCIIRWNASTPHGGSEEIEISKRQEDTIHKLFLDPTGNHLLACLHGGETYYLHSAATRPKRLLKWSGVVVEAVAFDSQRCTEGSTKGIVVGTRSGDLYESSLESNGKERPFSLVFSLSRRQSRSGDGTDGGSSGAGGRSRTDSSGLGGGGGGAAGGAGGRRVGGDAVFVAALYLESMSSAVHGETRVFVMAVTASPLRLYLFMGGPTLEVMFREHRESGTNSFRELPGNMLSTELHVYRKALGAAGGAKKGLDNKDGGGGVEGVDGASATGPPRGRGGVRRHKETPHSFALLTSMGIYHGSLALGNEATPGNVIAEAQLVPYPEEAGDGGGGGGGGGGGAVARSSSPLSMAMTEFHFLLLFTGRLQVVSRLNGAVVQEESLETHDPTMGHVLTLLTDPYTGGGAMQGAAPGIGVANRLWLFTDRLPFKLRVSHEERDVWMLFLEKAVAGEEAHFEDAAQHCKNAIERAQVHYVQAGWYFRRGQHTVAARYYAKTPCCFEEIALKFMECEDGWKATALKTYLLERLGHLSQKQGEYKMQRTMLCTWLTEIFLRGFNYLPLDSGTAREREDAENSLAEELKSFLRGYSSALDPATTMNLLSKHGRGEEALFYATLVEDYDRVLAHHASHGPDHKAALEVLRKAPFDKVEPLVYKYSASLMAADPAGTIGTWMSKPQLKPTKLIPALVRYSQRRKAAMARLSASPPVAGAAAAAPTAAGNDSLAVGEGEDLAIKYLEFCVNDLNLKDAAIHNHLLALYAQAEEWREGEGEGHKNKKQHPSSSSSSARGYRRQEDDTYKALSGAGSVSGLTQQQQQPSWLAEGGDGTGGGGGESASRTAAARATAAGSSSLLAFIARPPEERFFDPMYALRLCSQHGRSLACVHLYSAMGLWEEAVDLALTVDTDMAKANANKAPDPETRKLLWLKIAKREVERCRSTDIEGTMRVLQECDLLKIEDILPFFPDFVVIDSFKREICVSLEEYNGKIESLRKEMEDYTLSSEAVQAEIVELQQRSIYVSSNQTCELCKRNILSTQFYVFPCGHAFHSECLLENIRPHLSAEQRSAVESLVAMIAAGGGGGGGGGGGAKHGSAAVGGGRGAVGAAAAAANGGADGSKRAQHYLRSLQTELDGYVAAECVLCGDMMVQSVDKPLVTVEEQAEQMHQWAL